MIRQLLTVNSDPLLYNSTHSGCPSVGQADISESCTPWISGVAVGVGLGESVGLGLGDGAAVGRGVGKVLGVGVGVDDGVGVGSGVIAGEVA